MKKFLKYSAIVLCITLLIATVIVAIAVNDKAEAATYTMKTGKYVDNGAKFNFNGTTYTVTVDDGAVNTYKHHSISVGEETTYYLVDTAAEFTSLSAANSSENAANVIIADDITFTNRTAPIATVYANIEGCSHTITFGSGCTAGLFTNFTGTVNDLTFNGTIAANSHFGAITVNCLYASTFTSVTNNATINCNSTGAVYVGAFIAQSQNPVTFNNCHNNGDITITRANAAKSYFGGFVANAVNFRKSYVAEDVNGVSVGHSQVTASFVDCTNTGDLTFETSSQPVGGFIGVAQTNVEFTRTNNSGDITANGTAAGYVGGLEPPSGYSYVIMDVNFTDCTNSGNITSKVFHAAGFTGMIKNIGERNFTRCTNNGTVSGTGMLGGFIVQVATHAALPTFTDCESNGDIKATGTDAQSLGGYIGQVDPVVTYKFEGCKATATIYANASSDSAYGGFIGKFNSVAGTLDCINCESNVTIKNDAMQIVGGYVGICNQIATYKFDGCSFGGEIASTAKNNMAGFIAGPMDGSTLTFTDCIYEGTVAGASNVAGFVAALGGTTKVSFDGCSYEGSITGTSNVGGYVGTTGTATITIDSCSSATTATVVGTSNSGGYLGYCGDGGKNTITNSTNAASVTCGTAGGFVGKCDGELTIEGCTNTGYIKTTGGGEAGAGGIVACVRNAGPFTITNCKNEGTVEGTAANSYVAGILGTFTRLDAVIAIDGCENKGTVKLTNEATKYAAAAGITAGVANYENWYENTDQNYTLTITNSINSGTILNEGTEGTAFSDLAGILARTGKAGVSTAVKDNAETPDVDETVKVTTNFKITIRNCANIGSIVDKYAGANADNSSVAASNAAGIVARCEIHEASGATSFLVIEHCYSAATYDIASTANNSAITRSYSAGKADYITVTNCYYVNEANNSFTGATKVTALQVSNGYLAYNLNLGGGEWYQSIDNGVSGGPDAAPSLTVSRGVVYATELKIGNTSLGNTFTNTNTGGEALQLTLNTIAAGLRLGETAETTGIRWTSSINTAHLEILKNLYGSKVKVGTLIVPAKFVGTDLSALTMEELDALAAANDLPAGSLYINVAANVNDPYASDEVETTFAGGLVKFASGTNLAMEYYGIAYIQIEVGGETITAYSSDAVKVQPGTILSGAYNGEDYSEEQKAIIWDAIMGANIGWN